MSPPALTLPAPLAPPTSGFDWRAALGPYRRRILQALGAGPGASGERVDDGSAARQGCGDVSTGSGHEPLGVSAATVTGVRPVGRPFLIDGRERLAPSAVRSDWYPSNGAPAFVRPLAVQEASSVSADTIALGWLEQALMEHASVAAFARFSLQLLQLGAPADLVAAAATGMQDEVRHARDCFELARRHSKIDRGPGRLTIEGALERMDLTAAVHDTLREGCIGETVAALEASEALAHCEDSRARAVLERIAVEEGEHAELAWRFVAWALETSPELTERVREAFALELAGAQPQRERRPRDVSAHDRELARHGLLGAPLRAALRKRVLSGVIAPCAEALLAGAGWRRPEPAAAINARAHPA